jgi:hypothetical protein
MTLRIFPEEQLRIQEMFIFQPIVDRLAADVVVHRILHNDRRRRLPQIADNRDFFGPDVQNLCEQLPVSVQIAKAHPCVAEAGDVDLIGKTERG